MVLAADAPGLQQASPDAGEHLLLRPLGSLPGHRCLDRGRQGLLVDLSIDRQGQPVQHHHSAGHHVVGQHMHQLRAQRFCLHGLPCKRRHVGHEPRANGVSHDNGLAHARLRQQHRLDLAGFDAQAAQLDLLVHASQEFELAIGAPARQVAAAVEAAARLAQRVGDEALRAERGHAEIAARKPLAAQVQLSGHAGRHGLHVGIQHPGLAFAHGPAYGRMGTHVSDLADIRDGRRDHGLGRAIGIEDTGAGEHPPGQRQPLGRQGLAADDATLKPRQFQRTAQLVGKQPQIAQRKVQRADASLGRSCHEFARRPRPRIPRQHGRPAGQRHHPLLAGGVKAHGGEQQAAVLALHAMEFAHGLDMHGQGSMGHGHPLGTPRRARGIDHIGQAVRMHGRQRLRRPGACRHRCVQCQHQGHGIQLRRLSGLGEKTGRAAVHEHMGQALRRMPQVQRHEGGAGLHDGQQAHDHVGRGRQSQSHPAIGADAMRHQQARGAIDTVLQLTMAERCATINHRRRIGMGLRLPGDQFVDQAVGQPGALSPCPPLQAVQRLGVDQTQIAQRLVGRMQQGLEQGQIVRLPARHRIRFEQLSGVAETHLQPAIGTFQNVQRQFDLGRLAAPLHGGDAQSGQPGQRRIVMVHMVEHHLEQRTLPGTQRLDKLLVRQVLVRLRARHGRAHLFHQMAQAAATAHLRADDHGVDEHAHHCLGLRMVAPGHGHAHPYVLQPRMAVQQRLEGGQQECEDGAPLLAGPFAQAPGQVIGHASKMAGRLIGWPGLPGMVRRQFDQG
ncbi:hypothetical protein BW39_04581 [Delftia sp. RIT313]|nr:hypothetical protein BW39_04581 [Delftia sp. RIT313]